MSNLDLIRFRVSLLEQKLGVKRGSRLFWLYVVNWFASLWFVLFLAWWLDWVFGLVVFIVIVAIIFRVNVTDVWNGVTDRGVEK